MAVLKEADTVKESIGDKRSRYLTHGDKLMMVIIDFDDGPTDEPDPPHNHTHEQMSYVVEGELYFFIDGEKSKVGPGDMVVIPPGASHSVQLLSSHVRLVDTFTPLREDFLK